MSPDTLGTVVGSLAGLFTILGSWWRWGRPRWKRFWWRLDGTLDAINGREEYVDSASGTTVPALPPLTTRVALIETAIVEFRHNTALYTELAKRVDVHDHEIRALKEAQVERLVTRAESAQMWRAVADAQSVDNEHPED